MTRLILKEKAKVMPRSNNTYIYYMLILLTLCAMLLNTALWAETESHPQKPEKTEEPPVSEDMLKDLYNDVMHPQFQWFDQEGNKVDPATAKISTQMTCGKCHDARYINRHNNHYNNVVKADCIVCHIKGSRLTAGEKNNYADAFRLIQLPDNNNCAHCHGLVQENDDPLSIPQRYAENFGYLEGEKCFGITRTTGAVMAAQDIARSALNIKDKKNRHFSWDVHSRRRLDCSACHLLKDGPRQSTILQSELGHLRKDPRKVRAPRQYLKRPNHELRSEQCSTCHDPFKVHKGLPYKRRHMTVLSCQSCHVPKLFAPAFKSVDGTVLTAAGYPKVEYRGVNKDKSHGNSLNTMFIEGFSPFLFPHLKSGINPNPNPIVREQQKEGHKYNISPFNLITRWYWKSAKDGKEVDEKVLGSIFLENGTYRPEILALLDSDKNGKLEAQELHLNSEKKIAAIAQKLKAAGIDEPVIAGTVDAYKVNHGVMQADHLKRDCADCHTADARFGAEVELASAGPKGVVPQFAKNTLPLIDGDVVSGEDGRVVLVRSSSVTGHYVFGHSRLNWMDNAGIWIFVLSLVAIMLHGGFRVWSFISRKSSHRVKTKWVYMYSVYERIWHWTMAGAIILLAVTGLEIHYAGSFSLFGLEPSIHIHNVLATILVINAFLSLFYHIATGKIKQFFGFNRKFIQETLVQAFYYISGIFKGERHPVAKSLERKLNPLQQLTYIGLLNFLLPFQIITGILILGAGLWPGVAQNMGGLTFLAPVHNLGSWLFITFLVVHVYLTTTGHTVISNIRAMITGYDEVEKDGPDEEHKQLMEMPVIDLMGTLIGKFGREKVSKDVKE